MDKYIKSTQARKVVKDTFKKYIDLLPITEHYASLPDINADIQAGLTVIPFTDVVEVVRCKDCRGWLKSGICRKTNAICAADDYCSKAERK